MAFFKWILPLVAMTMLFVGLVGCQSSDVTETDSEQPGAEETPAAKSDMDKMMEALADLPEADRKSAMKQHFCPVSGEMLGVMGAPEKIDVNGQTVWICCDGCKDKLLADPDKYLAKLNN